MTAQLPPDSADVTDADRAKAADAIELGRGICRTCLAPIWNEGGTVGRVKRAEGWSDRTERGGDSLVCFKAVEYRHVPLTGREAAIYDRAYARGTAERAAAARPVLALAEDMHRSAESNRGLAAHFSEQADECAANFHLGLAQAWDAAERRARATVAAALGETGGGQ